MASAQGARTERSRGYLSSRTSAANRLEDGSSPTRRDNNSTSSGTIRPTGSTGRLFDPKKDPVLVVPSTSATQQQQANAPSRSGPADPRNLNSSSRKQQNHRLYDPNQAQPQSVRQDGASISSASASLAATAAAPQTPKQGSTPPSPMDGLVKLTKEIQTLEKKVMVMEQPSRRRLDSDDDDTENSQQSGGLTWNRRMDNSKRLAAKYLKLIQLDFKSSLKHDIDTRCWKLAIYPLIETFRAALRNSEHTAANGTQSLSDSDEDHTENIRHHFTEFIGFAQEFYASLKTTLQKLEEKHSTPNRNLTRTGTPPRWHRSVGIMGDLARYRWLHKLDDDASPPTDWLIVARRLYREAIDLGPCNGKMYNQLALLSGGRGLESMYYYSKSLTVRSSFMNARDTLMSFFAANEQIQVLANMSLKHSAKARQAILANGTLKDCEGSYLLLQAMLFQRINLDNFDKRLKFYSKQLRSLHVPRNPNGLAEKQEGGSTQPERWDGFYFMQAVINIAAVYEFNWSASAIAKSNTAFGKLTDHLATIVTLPYSSKLLLFTMEQSMSRYLAGIDEISKKMTSPSLEEQQGWLVYCHVVLVWMASRPFGTGSDMAANWLMMANHLTLPTFWETLTTFMNHHWRCLTPFEQSDMLSAVSEEMADTAAAEQGHDQESRQTQENTMFMLSLPPLGHEWELRGLAWMPNSRFGSEMFKGSRPMLDDMEVKGSILWKQDSFRSEHLSKRIVELSLIAAMHMKIIEFDFCENAFKISDDYTAHVEETMASSTTSIHQLGLQLTSTSTEEDSMDENPLSSSYASITHDSGIEDDEASLFSSDGTDYSIAEILELKNKRDQLKSLLSESNVNGRQTVSLGGMQRDYRAGVGSGSANGHGKKSKNEGRNSPRGYMDRRHQFSGELRHSQRGAMVADNSILVIDTNCLVADWTLIQGLVNADRWTVIIPLAVITELDGLKNNPAPLGPSASAALAYLEGCIAMKPKPRRLKIQTSRGNYMNDLSFRVESFNYEKQHKNQPRHKKSSSYGGTTGGSNNDDDEEDYDGDEEIMRNHNVDDFILGLCLWHQKNGPSASLQSVLPPGSPSNKTFGQQQQQQQQQGVFLVTDDRNLRVKARARTVEVLGREDVAWMTGHESLQR
ncbi:hypothetical protein BGX34_007483 [Mortierella sp. NVP85]|nr:hypothetical protein BGX34_007483 [Mortierella sp. NVP85]